MHPGWSDHKRTAKTWSRSHLALWVRLQCCANANCSQHAKPLYQISRRKLLNLKVKIWHLRPQKFLLMPLEPPPKFSQTETCKVISVHALWGSTKGKKKEKIGKLVSILTLGSCLQCLKKYHKGLFGFFSSGLTLEVTPVFIFGPTCTSFFFFHFN